MHPILDTHREQVAALCRQFGVRRLEAFGSVLRPDFGPASDIDLLVAFDREVPAMDAFERYFGFKEAVESLVGHAVDLVVADSVRNEAFRAELNRTKSSLYVAVPTLAST